MAPGYLPWDITTEILSRLPVKSLIRFKCVSESFYDLISNDPRFKKKHLDHHQSNLKILVPDQYETLGGESAFSCSLVPLSPAGDVCEDMIELELPVRIGDLLNLHACFYNFCDGLFCIGVHGEDVIIWNPSTREAKEFPGGHHLVEKENGYLSWIRYSLAHDSRSNVYKLLGIFEYNYNTYRLRFYSAEMEMWRYVEDCPPCNFVNYDSGCTIVNGAFHWLGGREANFKTSHVVVSLDISDETYGTLVLPQALYDSTNYPTLCVLEGKLCVFGNHSSERCRDIWVMKEYGVVDSMMRMFRIPSVELPEFYCWPMYMLLDDTIIIYRLSVGTSFYKDGRFLGNPIVGRPYFNPVPYVYFESLISPHTLLEKVFSSEIVAAATTRRGKQSPHTLLEKAFSSEVFVTATRSRGKHSSHTLLEKAISSEIVANNFSAKHVATKKPWLKNCLQRLCCWKSFCHDRS